MGNWQLIKEIFKGTGLYKKQFLLFMAVFLLFCSILGLKSYNNYLSADPMDPDQIKSSGDPQTITLNITKDGRIFRDGHVVSLVELGKDYDTVRYKVIDSPGVYIDKLTVFANFQTDITSPLILHEVKSERTDNGYSINVESVKQGDKQIIYIGRYLGPDTVFTVYARFPHGIFTPPWWRSSAFDVTSLSITVWIIIGLSLPLATLILLLIMLSRRWLFKAVKIDQITSVLPEKIPPAVVGVLMNGKIGPREIASTLIDLARRGYIHIFEDKDNFSFGRGSSLESEKIYELNNFEKLLLSKIFEPSSATNNMHEINIKLSKTLFSQKIAQVYVEIYTQVAELGYFQQNPGLTHQRYKFWGMLLFFISSLGFILNTMFNKTFPFLIFFWVGMMASSTLIIYFSPKMPVLTQNL